MATKVLIYAHSFAPNIGGVETIVMLLARDLAESGVQVALVTPTAGGAMGDEELPFKVIRKPGLAALVKLIWRTDVLHLAGPCFVPMMLGLVLRKPVAVEHHGYQSICPSGVLFLESSKSVCPDHFMAGRYQKCLQCNARTAGWARSAVKLLLTFARRWACRHVAKNIAVSNHVEKRLRLPNSEVILHGIQDGREGRDRTIEGPATMPGCFAYAGRLVSEKGLETLLKAASRLNEEGYIFRLVLIGDGPERARLEKGVDILKLRDRVTFTGFLSGSYLESALSRVVALVMPSISEETAGLSAIEQMMRGRMVIVSDIGGLGEMVGDAGLRFPRGDAAALALCMKRVLDEPALSVTLGKRARERALRLFLGKRMASDHLALYHEMVGIAGPPPVREEPCHSSH